VPGWRARGRETGAGRRGRGPRSRAFTLLEILLVLMLLGLLGAVLVGGATSLLKAVEEQDPEAAVLSLLQKARAQSVETGQVVELVPLPDDIGFLLGREGVEALPVREGLRVRLLRPEMVASFLIGGQLEERPIERVRFYPDGSCDPMRLEVRRGDQRRVMIIDPWTAAPLPEGGTRR
jgi:prepilin-type N-terminal cleavage/methylation domain-containing protein